MILWQNVLKISVPFYERTHNNKKKAQQVCVEITFSVQTWKTPFWWCDAFWQNGDLFRHKVCQGWSYDKVHYKIINKFYVRQRSNLFHFREGDSKWRMYRFYIEESKKKKKKTHEKCNYENSLVSSWQNSCVYKELHHFMRNIKYLN